MTCNTNISTNTYYGSNANKTKKTVSIDPNLIKHENIPKDAVVVDFADYLVEQGYFSSKEEFMEYIKGTDVFPGEENSAGNKKGGITEGETFEIEVNGQKYDAQMAVFEFPRYKYYTGNEGYTSCSVGDAENDRYVNLGMRYKSSCFDFTYQDDYYTTKLNLEGMTNEEKYLEIYEFFKHCYGENFLDVSAINYVAPMQEDPYMGIWEKFNSFVTKACGLSEKYPENSQQLRQLRREALYGDMSDEKIRAAIREKYPPAGELTFRDLYKMINEMDLCGVGGFASDCVNWVFKDRYHLAGIDTREAMLDSTVNSDHIKKMLNDYEAKVYQNLPMDKNLGTVIKEIAAEFGAAGGVSLSTVSANSVKDDFVWIKL